MASIHFIRARVRGSAGTPVIATAAAALFLLAPARAQQTATGPAPATFTIFFKSTPIGSEQFAVERTADGWTISGTGRVGAPLDVMIRKVEARYDPAWKPLALTVDATLRGQVQEFQTVVSGTTATSTVSINGTSAEKTDTIDPAAILLPNPFIAPYEAVAAQLRTAEPGTVLSAYIAPQGSVTMTVGASNVEQIQTLARIVTARRTLVTVQPAAAGDPQVIEVWGDEEGRLLRFSVPSQMVDALREDIAAVSSRRVSAARPNDEQVRVPANGFSLAATISKPAAAAAKPLPAVVLVAGSGPTDRDEMVFGIPIFGQIAAALADAGFTVIRYDKRGIGQSGGRPESATLADFAEDLGAVVRYMSDRRDVDRRRIAVAGHSEGAALALLVAARTNRVAALVLIAGPGTTGADINMWQVEHQLDRAKVPAEQKAATLELQKRIQAAVLTGKGWDGIPPDLRKQAEIPWFQSFLAFDPAKPIADTDQPILIVQGLLDKQVPPPNADRLEALARARRKAGAVEAVRVPGVNHLLVPATTGEVDEYRVLPDRNVSPAVIEAIVGWLRRTF